MGAASGRWPAVGLTAAGLALLGLMLLAVRGRVRSPFAFAGFALVGGYVMLNRGFAGFHLPLGPLPLYVGELALAPLLLLAIARLRGRPLGAPVWLLALWMAFNLALTLPHIGTFGLVAIRDAAIWYYGLYMLVGMAAWQSLDAQTTCRWLGWIFVATIFTVVASMMTESGILPPIELPISDGPLIGNRDDANAMYLLAGAALFLTSSYVERTPWPRSLTPVLVLVAFGLVAAAQHRSAFVALAAVLALLAVLRLWRPVVVLVGAGTAVIVLLYVLNVSIEDPESGRPISARTIVQRQLSTVAFLGGGERAVRSDSDSGTIRWRTIWWDALLRESLADPRLFLVGRGYGPDLRDAVRGLEGQTLNWNQGSEAGRTVRAPHNIAVTVLARSGLVGLVLWLTLLGACCVGIIRAIASARRAGARDDEMLGVWLATFVTTVVVASLFGVVLESPFGAVPFFFILGLGVAWSRDRTTH